MAVKPASAAMPLTPAQARVLRLLAAGGRVRTKGFYGAWLGLDAVSGTTVRALRRRGLIVRDDLGYVITEAGRAEASRLGSGAA